MAKIKLEIDKAPNETITVRCVGWCRASTKHTVLASVNLAGEEEWDPGYMYYWNDSYQIIQCAGCETISFRQTHQNSEDTVRVGNDPADLDYGVDEVQYPSPVAGRGAIQDHHTLPSQLHRIYLETIKAINSKQPVLAGIGIRAIVETVCEDKKAKGRNLLEKIDDLVGQGVLTKEGSEILHKLRTLGNEAAHEAKPHDDDHLSLAMDVIDHLLSGVYVLGPYARSTFK